jgi:non-homologous end joining protein Ku
MRALWKGAISSEGKPEQYTDEYHKALKEMIEQKIRRGGKKSPVTPAKKKQPANVVDRASVPQQTLV